MTPMMRSTLDVALWFIERAESVGTPLSNRKLQSLLYLAQAHFANANRGRRLMPAIFLAADAGPLEPTIYHIFQDGPPVSSTPCRARRSKHSYAKCGGVTANLRMKRRKTSTIKARTQRGECRNFTSWDPAVTPTRRWWRLPSPVHLQRP